MKKNTLLLTSLGLMTAVAIGIFAFGGTKQFEPFQVKADPTDYCVTFDETVIVEGPVDNHYCFYTRTTLYKNKVGISGDYIDPPTGLSFKGCKFEELAFYGQFSSDAFKFNSITGFQVTFAPGTPENETIMLVTNSIERMDVTNGTKYEMPLTDEDAPYLCSESGVTVEIKEITIWYYC